MVVLLKILQTLSPLNLELLRGPLVCYCLFEKGKSCAPAAENLPFPIKTLGARLIWYGILEKIHTYIIFHVHFFKAFS